MKIGRLKKIFKISGFLIVITFAIIILSNIPGKSWDALKCVVDEFCSYCGPCSEEEKTCTYDPEYGKYCRWYDEYQGYVPRCVDSVPWDRCNEDIQYICHLYWSHTGPNCVTKEECLKAHLFWGCKLDKQY